jgi:hypothetical protein
VWLIDASDRHLAEAQVSNELSRRDNRAIELRLRECISEAQLKLCEDVRASVERHRLIDSLRHRPQLIDAMAVIAVRVRHDHSVEAADLRREQLLPEIGPAVDEHTLIGALHQYRGAQARVARLGRIAAAPIVPDFRNSGRSSAAEDSKLHPQPC